MTTEVQRTRRDRVLGALAAAALMATMVATPRTSEALACTLGSTSGNYGSGYAIATAADLAQIGSACGMSSTYYLTADITMTAPSSGSSNHTPIGSSGNQFYGYLLGQGHSISGLVINAAGSDDVGFFSVLGEYAGVEEITFTNATVVGGDRVGIVAGTAHDTYPYDVTVEGSVTGANEVGGMYGYMNLGGGLLISADVTVVGTGATGKVGGLVGRFGYNGRRGTSLEEVEVTGTVTGAGDDTGGIVGYTDETAALKKFSVDADITGAGNNVGGVFGRSRGTSTSILYLGPWPWPAEVSGSVTGGGDYVGGVGGRAEGVENYVVLSVDADVTMTGANPSYGGGIFGYTTGGTYPGPMSFTGDLSSPNGTYIGGIYGANRGAIEIGAPPVVTGAITGKAAVGGVAGLFGPGGTLEKVKASATVTGNTDVGGLVGLLDGTGFDMGGYVGVVTNGGVKSSKSLATVTGTTNVGGVVGRTLDATLVIENVYSTATVTGTTNVGGLLGKADNADGSGATTVKNSYAAGLTTRTGGTADPLVGAVQAGTVLTVDDLYFDTDLTGLATSTHGTAADETTMTDFDTFNDAGWPITDGWAAGKAWSICSPMNGGYPFLSWEIGSITPCLIAPTWVDDELGALEVGEPLDDGVEAEGSATITYSVSAGDLPDGLTLDTATGAITGTPTTPGAYDFTIKATNAKGFVTVQFTGTVIATAPTWVDDELADFVLNQPFDDGVEADGTAPITYSVSAGTLPDGLTLDTATGAITGTPTTEGAYDFTIKATNVAGFVEVQFTGTVTAPAPEIDIVLEFSVGANIRSGDQTTTVRGSGLQPNSPFSVVLRSDPVEIGSGTADGNGDFEAVLTIPANTPAGSHSATVYGTAPDGSPLEDVTYFSLDANGLVTAVSEVSPTPSPPDDVEPPYVPYLPATGSSPQVLQLALVVLAAGLVLRRRTRC